MMFLTVSTVLASLVVNIHLQLRAGREQGPEAQNKAATPRDAARRMRARPASALCSATVRGSLAAGQNGSTKSREGKDGGKNQKEKEKKMDGTVL